MKTIISIPHSSLVIPEMFHYQFFQKLENLKRHIDFGVDYIINFNKYKIIKAEVSRFVIDLNREREDIDSDQGVIINKDWDNIPVLKRRLNNSEIEERLKYYDQFYSSLKNLILDNPNSFLLDCHSMDSKNHSEIEDQRTDRPDICLANNFGKSCSKEMTEIFLEEFKKEGYWIEENNPYNGSRAKIINFANQLNIPALELEINKKVYMDEKSFILYPEKIENLRLILKKVLNKIKSL